MLRTYRNAVLIPIIGTFFVLFSLAVSGRGLYHLTTGSPLIVRSGYDIAGHVASNQELLASASIPAVFFLVGVMMILGWRNITIELNDQGIRQRGIWGQETFNASWPELTEAFKRINGRGHAFYGVKSRTGKLEFANTQSKIDDLVLHVKAKAHHLDFSQWV